MPHYTSSCGVPATAQAYVLNATVVPPGALGYITMWPQGESQPLVATLNAVDGAITSNMAVVPTTNGPIDVFASAPTHLVLDIFGYFAQNTPSILTRQVTFSPAQSFNSGVTSPAYVATGDLNGDGYLDLVVTNLNSIAVFLGKGDGTFKQPTIYTTDFYVSGWVAVGDFNGDGNLDIVVVGGDFNQNSLALFTGKGDGTFTAPAYIKATLVGSGISMVVGDLNNDHKPDIFIGGNGASEALLGDGKGGFQEVFVDGNSGFSVALGDFNGDGNLDVAATGFTTDVVTVLLGKGDGTFQAPQTYSNGSRPTGVAAGDFNGDKKLDLAVTSDPGNGVFFWLGNGEGRFTSAAGGWPAGTGGDSIITADFNKDGNADLAVANFTGDGVTVLTSRGDGTFPLSADFPTGTNPGFVVAGDFNNDGSPDLAVTNYGNNSVSILLNGAGTRLQLYSSLSSSTPGQPVTFTALVVGSVNTSLVPTGTVLFRDGSTVLGSSPIGQGNASFTTSGLASGSHKIFAVYSGDGTFSPNVSGALVQTVN